MFDVLMGNTIVVSCCNGELGGSRAMEIGEWGEMNLKIRIIDGKNLSSQGLSRAIPNRHCKLV